MAKGSRYRAGQRHYGLDWLRMAAFALVIFHHICMVFAPGDWLVKAPDRIDALVWPMLALQPWRMPLLFVVSGYASYALFAKGAGLGRFLRARSGRLLLPLLFGVLVINPPQMWVSLVTNHGYGDGFLHFWLVDWFSLRPVDGVIFSRQVHLWFIAYLWTYTMLLGAGLGLLPVQAKQWLGTALERLGTGLRLLWVPLLVLLAVRLGLLFTVPEVHGLLHDWVSDSTYLPAFLFGFALAGAPSLWPAVRRCRWPAALLALASYLILVRIEIPYPGGVVARPHLLQAFDRSAALVMAWSMILLLLGAAHQWLNRDHPLRQKLGELVFPFFLIHHTILVTTAWWIKDSGIGAPAMFAVIVTATLAGCWAFYEAGRRIGPLRPLIGLSPQKRAPRGSSHPALNANVQPALAPRADTA